MKLIRLRSVASAKEVSDLLLDPSVLNEKIKPTDGPEKPSFSSKQKGNAIRLKCTYIGGPNRDNGFLQGTICSVRVRELEEGCLITGHVVTEPIFHALWLLLIAFFVWRCISLGGFSVVPICLIVFVFFMMKKEYKKQSLLYHFVCRAVRTAEGKKK